MKPDNIESGNLGQTAEAKLVDEKTLELFWEKSNFLLNKSEKNPFDFSEIFLRDFIGYIFERNDLGTDGEPFEERLSREYKDIWLPQVNKDIEKKDYSGYAMWRYNPIVLYRTRKGGKIINEHRIILKNDTGNEGLDFIENKIFSIMSPITYVGRNRYAKNARYLYAFAIDLDGVGMKQMRDYIHQQRTDLISKWTGELMSPHAPMANIVVNSGHGLHVYFLLNHPVALYKENIPLLRKMKEGLTKIVWNAFTSELKDIQYQGIFQGFRMPGTLTKFGEKIRAFRNEEAELHTIESLNGFLGGGKLTDEEIAQLNGKMPYKPIGVTIDEAKRQWPEWYEKVIVMGDKMPKKWHIKRDLYDWWLRRLRDPRENIIQGHRYFCLLALATYAVKCDISKEELTRDAYSLLKRMDKLTEEEDNHFTEQDIEDALMGYKVWYCTFPRNSISYLTGLPIKENRRNGRKQKIHLAGARAIQKINDPDEEWREGNGRPIGSIMTLGNSKVAARIKEWMQLHSDCNNKSACAKELGLTRPTVRKWWNIIQAESQVDELEKIKGEMTPITPQYQMMLTSEEMYESMSGFDELKDNDR